MVRGGVKVVIPSGLRVFNNLHEPSGPLRFSPNQIVETL
jgi:hypothetical protein